MFIAVTGCKKDDHKLAIPATSGYGADIPLSYFNLALKLTKEGPGFSPPVAARTFGYIGLALYEAVVPGEPDYQSLQGQLSGFPRGIVTQPESGQAYNWEIVANSAMSFILQVMYRNASKENLEAIKILEADNLTRISSTENPEIKNRSEYFGRRVARDIWLYAASDGQEFCYNDNFPMSFTPPSGNGFWTATPPAFQRALQPYWGAVRTFVPANVSVAAKGHPDYSTSLGSIFYEEGKEVFEVVKTLSPEQKIIAEFWSDDPGKTATPPGHSISIALQVLEKETADLMLAAETFAKVGMGVHDAFVSCWKSKYDYNLLRPVTYVQAVFDPAWKPHLPTPPFPEYPSGHSVQSGAAAEILTGLFGGAYAFTDNTHLERTDIDGSPRAFASFFEAADEAAISRLYGGIHFKAAIEDGVNQGRKIGENINQLVFKP